MVLHLPHSSLDDVIAEMQASTAAPAGDVTFVAAKGPIVADDANGHTYRIGTHNGALIVTQVT